MAMRSHPGKNSPLSRRARGFLLHVTEIKAPCPRTLTVARISARERDRLLITSLRMERQKNRNRASLPYCKRVDRSRADGSN